MTATPRAVAPTKPKAPPRRMPLWVWLAVVVLPVVLIGLSVREGYLSLLDRAGSGQARVQWDGGQLVYTGRITRQGVDRLAQELDLAKPDHNVELHVAITGGRMDQAERMARLIAAKPVTLYVGRNSLCLSACVYVYLAAPRKFADDTAWFGFHLGHPAASPDAFSVGRLLSWVLHSGSDDRVMQSWAARFSPRLAEFFRACRVNPVATDAGMALSWRDIAAIRNGVQDFACQDKLSQTLGWAIGQSTGGR